jgi:glycolate oxidase iron-sulfur subunit
VLTGCVQDLAFSDVNRATVDVLLANGCEVHTPPVQPCCGSLHAHNGDTDTARVLARRQLDLINPENFDAIISNAGGCGSHLRAYDHLLHDDSAYAARAVEWSRKLRDIHEFLVEIGFRHPRAPGERRERPTSNAQHSTSNEKPGNPEPTVSTVSETSKLDVGRSTFDVGCSRSWMLDIRDKSPSSSLQAKTTVTYHESCHLCHGQKVSAQPRAILKSLPGVELRECAEAQWCCGSAGIYNITQPDTSAWLQDRKIGHLAATGAQVVATANPGCHLQIQSGLAAHGHPATEIAHPIVLLARAYAAESVE